MFKPKCYDFDTYESIKFVWQNLPSRQPLISTSTTSGLVGAPPLGFKITTNVTALMGSNSLGGVTSIGSSGSVTLTVTG
jgi:hypothetical protein